MNCPLIPVSQRDSDPTVWTDRCINSGCMYFTRNAKNNCQHSRLQHLPDPSDQRKESVLKAFSMNEEELNDSIRRILAITAANTFFMFLFGKDITEARESELAKLESSGTLYVEWRPKAPKPNFAEILHVVDILRKHLV